MSTRSYHQSRWLRLLVALIVVTGLVAGTAPAGTAHAAPPEIFSNPTPFTINSFGIASPYFTPVFVTGVTAPFSHVSVTLFDFEHASPDDVQVLLRGPNGNALLLMENNGSLVDVADLDLTFDVRGEPIPSAFGVALRTTTYQPLARSFPLLGNLNSPAPLPPYSTNFDDLYTSTPNGLWRLYVRDAADSSLSGAINGGWSISFFTPGITVTPTGGLATSEGGADAVFEVVLDGPPLKPVFIPLSSSDTSEGIITPSGLTFTPDNWDVPQSVFVLGQDDSLDDGNIDYAIITDPAISLDSSYTGLNAANVTITNFDNDTANILVNPTSGLTTNENGSQANFSVVLESQPTADVTIALGSDDDTEGIVNPTNLTFTPGNWNTAQEVTVTGVNDDVDDGDQPYNIEFVSVSSGDPSYDGFSVAPISGTNADNDTAAIDVSPISGNTTEAGGTAEFSVVLESEPTDDVLIGFSSSNPAEGTVPPGPITFTAANWDVPQIVTVTGVDDAIDDGAQTYIIFVASNSGDADYHLMAYDVTVTNDDDDGADVSVTPAGSQTTEAGGGADFTFVLASQPLNDVQISFSSSNTTEGIINAGPITFTPANWNQPQTVTNLVIGVDDDVDDNDQPYQILLSVSSADPGYNGIALAPRLMINIDDDTAGINVNPTSGLQTTEAGGTASFDVVLESEPTAPVIIDLTSHKPGEGDVNKPTLNFTPANWDQPQTVTVTGVDDPVDDDDQTYSIISSASSADPLYDNFPVPNVDLINEDDDTANILVQLSGNLETSESGGIATFSVTLASRPTADVSIPTLSSSDTSEGRIDRSSLNFTPNNWNVPQTVTITGQDDAVDDGDISYSIEIAAAISGDPLYSGLDPADPPVTNRDNDTAGIVFSPITVTTGEDGSSADFSVVLTSEPTADVTISLSSDNTAEGTVAPPSLIFTPANWNQPQLATVTGVDDAIDDGNIDYCIAANAGSGDPNYDGRSFPCAVAATNVDDDGAGITVSPLDPNVGLPTEAGGSAEFSVVLDSQPVDNVVIDLSSSDTTEGTVSCGAEPSLTFNAGNWNIAQVCTITGVDDFVDDGDVGFTIVLEPAISNDPLYSGEDPADVAVVTIDDDSVGIAIDPISGLESAEDGSSATFSVVLSSEPTADVIVSFTSSDTTEATVEPASLTFSAGNWNQAQTAIVTGVDDDTADGDQPYTIVTTASSSDSLYNALNPADVAATNLDDDGAGITRSPMAALFTGEDGSTATFTLVLDSQPTSSVTIPLIESDDTTEGTTSPTSLTFTRDNWNQPRTVTIRGVDDQVDDGNIVYQVTIGAADSGDPLYDGIDLADPIVTNVDDDDAGLTLSPDAGLVTSEDGDEAILAVSLTSEPADTVTINLSSSDSGEGTVSPASLSFDALNWNRPQLVTISGVDDAQTDGSQVYAVVLSISSSDSRYAALAPVEASVTNLDNEAGEPGVTVTPTEGLETSEAGESDSFSTVLDTQPSADVTITLSSDDTGEGSVDPETLVFTPGNWNVAQVVTVQGVDDDENDGKQSYSILTTASSSDSGYDGIAVSDVSVTNIDNDGIDVSVSAISGVTSEDGASATFSVVLTAEPASNVLISVSSTDLSEGTVNCGNSAQLTFTPANWNQPQTCTVTPVDDEVADGDITYPIRLAPIISADNSFAGKDPPDVNVINQDNDSAGIIVDPTSGLETSERGQQATFTVVLTSQPTASVVVNLSSSDSSEGRVSPSSLIFTASNWNTARTVTVTGVNDTTRDGDIAYRINVTVSSSDSTYNSIDPDDVSVTNRDDPNDPGGAVDPEFSVYLPLIYGSGRR